MHELCTGQRHVAISIKKKKKMMMMKMMDDEDEDDDEDEEAVEICVSTLWIRPARVVII